MNLVFSGQIFEKSSSIKSHENSCSGAELFHADRQWRTEGGGGVFNPPPPRNSEGPPKSYQTQPDCENC